MQKIASQVFFAGLIGIVASAPALGGEMRGFMLAGSCLTCHGDGSPNAAGIPDLSGSDAAFIIDALKKFRSGELESTVMQRLARGYSDKEITLIATWLAERPQR